MKLVKTILIVGELVVAMASIAGAAPKAVIVVQKKQADAVVVHRTGSNHVPPFKEVEMAEQMLPDVEYRDIPGFEGYKVGADGTLWSCRRHSGGWVRISGSLLSNGYRKVSIALGSRTRFVQKHLHALVLLAFSGPRPTGYQCLHRNGNKDDNRIENLQWGTPKENMADRERHGNTLRGSRHGMARLTESQVIEIRSRAAAGATKSSLAKEYGITGVAMCDIVNRHLWRHI